MSSNRLRVRDVKVCPQNVDYAAVNSDETICLYKDERLRPRAAHNHALAKPRSAQEHAQMTPIVENKKSVKLIDWYPKKDSNSLLALVHYNGRIILDKLECSLFQDKCSLYGKELISSKSTNRHCNAISWNSQQSNLLAQAFDKLNKEPSVVIWDINNIAGGGLGASGDSSAGLGGVGRHGGVGVSTSVGGGVSVPGTNHHAAHHSSSGHHHHRQVSDLSMKPIFDIAPNEIGHSIAWNPLDSNNLIAGLSHKFIRVYDIRESKPQQMTLTKAVFGLQLSPYDPMYLASHTNTEINIWDLRKFEKPVLTIPQERHIVKIEWSPEWRGVMATLTKDSQIIEIYDIKNTITVEDYDSKIIDRVIQPFKHKDVLTFTWNKTRKNCLMVLSVDGVHNISIHERKALTWSANNCISWTSERDVVNCEMEDMSRAMRTSSLLSARQWQTDDSLKLSNDISERIKQRALNDYGIQAS